MRQLSEWDQHEMFVTSTLNEADPIWGEPANVYESYNYGRIVLGDRSGSFTCRHDLRSLLQYASPENKAKLTTWVVDRNRAGIEFPHITADTLQDLPRMKALKFSAKIDRFLECLNERRYRVGDSIFPVGPTQTVEGIATANGVMRYIEAVSAREMWGFMQALGTAGLATHTDRGWYLTADGLTRLDRMDSQGAENNQAFVAMWFGDDMQEPYERGIVPGLADAGYTAFRIDYKEHSNKIDDEIIAEIRRSRFLVADFTSGIVINNGTAIQVPRGGVYYEAGFAQGLSMPVIWTVREDQIGLVHFDTRQFNHITWKDADDLRVKLSRRVVAVLGEGSAQQ